MRSSSKEAGREALGRPAMQCEPVIALDATLGDTRRNAQRARMSVATRKIIAFIGMQLVQPMSGASTTAAYRGQRINRLLEYRRVMPPPTSRSLGDRFHGMVGA